MRVRTLRNFAVLGVLLNLVSPQQVQAHGGLPVSQQVLRNSLTDTYYVPVLYWGIWVGKPGAPWKVLCEEEINQNRLRRISLSTDGALYATDTQGLTASRDGGCTWGPATGEIATLATSDVATDPLDGTVAYATTASAAGSNGLFMTRDRGASFTRVSTLNVAPGRQLLSVRIVQGAPRALYVTSRASAAPYAPMIHRSTDGGLGFANLPISYQLDGATPLVTEVLAVDPRNVSVVYVRAYSETRHALLRSTDGGMSFTEILKMDGVATPLGQSRGIDDVTIDSGRSLVWVATAAGLYQGSDPGGAAMLTLQKTGNLSQARCVAVHGGTVYACSSQFAPDLAAVGRSADGVAPFMSVLSYPETAGPVECPATTPMGMNCPSIWQMYKSQLGVGTGGAVDGGADAGMQPMDSGGGCAMGGGSSAGVLGSLLAALSGFLLLRRRRRAPTC